VPMHANMSFRAPPGPFSEVAVRTSERIAKRSVGGSVFEAESFRAPRGPFGKVAVRTSDTRIAKRSVGGSVFRDSRVFRISSIFRVSSVFKLGEHVLGKYRDSPPALN